MSKKGDLTDFISLKTLEKIQDNFVDATGISCVIRDFEGNALTKFSKPNRLWLEVIKHPDIEKEANENLLKALDKCFKSGQIEVYQRYLDTFAFAVPVMVDSKIKTFFIGGLVRYGNPNLELCDKEAKKLGVTVDDFLEMYLELPLVTKEKLMACAHLLKIIANALSSVAEEGEKKYQKLFDTMNDGIYIADIEGNIKDINAAGASMFGYHRDELIGKPIRNLYAHPSDRDAFLEKLNKQGHIENFFAYLKTKNGVAKNFETNATFMKDSYGHIIGIQGIVRDISHRQHHTISSPKVHEQSTFQPTSTASRQSS